MYLTVKKFILKKICNNKWYINKIIIKNKENKSYNHEY